jgi:GntR family transcriptional regulator, transcriptional repressor for pyruvate dehydrogenase complex
MKCVQGMIMRKAGDGQPKENEGSGRKSGVLFTPLRPRRAFEEISAEIKRMIFSGALKAGDRLPSETELAGQFGVSRQTLREALRRLELSGFIVMQKGASGGPLIVDTILNSIGDLFLDAFQLKKMTTEELTKARLDIEKMVLTNIFETDDRALIKAIRTAVDRTTKDLNQGIRVFDDNIHFHKLLARATGNYVFVIVMESLMTVVAHFHSVLRIDMKTIRSAHKAHESILDAIEKGDEKRAQEELRKDILEVDRTYKMLTKNSLKGYVPAAEGYPK